MGAAAEKLAGYGDCDGDVRRTAPRASAYVCIDVFCEHNFWTGLTTNMSLGGVFIGTHHAVPVGTMLVLNMLLPFEADPIVTLGEVRWARECTDHDDVAPGLGVQFVDIDPNSLAKIRTFVSTISEPLVLAH